MVYRLRKKFIRICMCSFLAVFVVLFGAIFTLTSLQTTHALDDLAKLADWVAAQSAQGSEQTDAYRSAAEDYESAMQWGSETDELYRRAADAYYGAQDYEKAESYYEKLLEKDEDVLARLIECSRALGTGKELAKRLQARYLETGEERYLQALC